MKDLVMSICIHYPWYKIEAFLLSWSRYVPDSDCVVFVDDLSALSLDLMHWLGVTAIQIPDEYQGKPICEYRWLMYKKYLEDHEQEYRQVFLCDIRDLVFQGNVFSLCREDRFICCALESGRICDDQFNSHWIRHWFGEEEYQKLQYERVICAGSVLGTARELLELIGQMEYILFSGKYPFLATSDQGPFNFIIRNRLISPEKLLFSDNRDGMVITIGSLQGELAVDGGLICNESGVLAAVIHQYDRKPALAGLIESTYRRDVLPLPENLGNDAKSALETAYLLTKKKDFRGVIHTVTDALSENQSQEAWAKLYYDDVLILWNACREKSEVPPFLWFPMVDLFLDLWDRASPGYMSPYYLDSLENLVLTALRGCAERARALDAAFTAVQNLKKKTD